MAEALGFTFPRGLPAALPQRRRRSHALGP